MMTNPAGPSEAIKETTTADFRQDVLQESINQPVLVDFWAPWCGPCKQLAPALEKAVKAAKGKVKLVKMNIDQHPQIAGQLGVQSIPAVFAFDRGQPVDGFVGNLPESQIKGFIDRLVGPDEDAGLAEALEAAQASLAAGDAAAAAEIYASILAADSENAEALGGLIRAQLVAGNPAQARRLADTIPEEKRAVPALAGALAELGLAEKAGELGELGELLALVEREPANHSARFDLALALNARGKRGEAAEALIAIIAKDRAWNDDGARKQLLQFFEAWGGNDDATVEGRRALSAVLFR